MYAAISIKKARNQFLPKIMVHNILTKARTDIMKKRTNLKKPNKSKVSIKVVSQKPAKIMRVCLF